jgi:aryl-alcohol dehydrogenase-like predicted oxidoreductase
MKYKLDDSELRVSELCLGTMTGQQNTLEENLSSLELTLDATVLAIHARFLNPAP